MRVLVVGLLEKRLTDAWDEYGQSYQSIRKEGRMHGEPTPRENIFESVADCSGLKEVGREQ